MRWLNHVFNFRHRSTRRNLKLLAFTAILITALNMTVTVTKSGNVKPWNRLNKFINLRNLDFTYGSLTLNKQQTYFNTSNVLEEAHKLVSKSACFKGGHIDWGVAESLFKTHQVNVCMSDVTDLDRNVPDSRPEGCRSLKYPYKLLSTSIIVTFHDEWLSILIRTIHSIINRTPTKWLREIILVDDASSLASLKDDLDAYLQLFPPWLIKMVRLPERRGLIQARLAGIAKATGEVVVIFDSHMEVNHYWLEPLLFELVEHRQTVAMATLDYVQRTNFDYFLKRYELRYGFDWRLIFFESFFDEDMYGKQSLVKPGVVTVGTAFAVRRDYFYEIGGYDDKMDIWGGENLELAWRVWLCGGRMTHVLCSRIGHVQRVQPYSFPGGREVVTMHNYKRAIEVWMEPKHKELVYENFPDMRAMDVGDLSSRLDVKAKLKCKPFSWFIKNIWPELNVLNGNVTAWGMLRNSGSNRCLDNMGKLFPDKQPFMLAECRELNANTGLSVTRSGLLQTQLLCVNVLHKIEGDEQRPALRNCFTETPHVWSHEKNSFLMHQVSGQCLDVDKDKVVMSVCDQSKSSQKWTFDYYL